jgi:hypothetical protein
MSTDSPANREFARSASPVNWYEVAKLMHENAHVLHNSPQGLVTYSSGSSSKTRRTSNRAVFLLAAFAMENLLKAFLIHQHPTYIEGGKLAKELLNGHSLSKLQAKCRKIPSPKRTRRIFETLEVGVNSWARYPCSTSIARESEERSVTPEFWAEYNRVFELYSQRLQQLLSKRWVGPYGEIGHVEFT